MSEKRILTIANHLGAVGGTETAQLAIFQALAANDWRVNLLYESKGDYWPQWSEIADSAIHISSVLPNRSSPISSSLGTAQAALVGAKTKPSVIYVHNAGDVPVSLALGAVRKVPLVTHLHLSPPGRQPQWLNALLRKSRFVIAPSTDAATRWTDRAALDPSKVAVIPTGIDVERFTPQPKETRDGIRREIDVGADELMILFAGRVERIKGVHFLLEALSRLPFPTRVVICGALSDQTYREQLMEASGANLVPMYLGRRPDIPQLMSAADLVAVPSNCLETQGLVVNEAMACGVPVVASDIGGLSESMAGFPSHLVPPADSQALAQAIERVVNWRVTDPDLGSRSRSWVVENNTFANTMASIDRLLSMVI